VSILTPDQRLRVFVSSTLRELAGERRAVQESIESLRLTPVMFEQGARPYPPRALYRAYLEQSDVFIGLYWERYGWVAPGEEVSGLEDEYGLSGDRPKLIYIKAPAPHREPRLADLITRIQRDDRASYRSFGDPDELRLLVADDLAVLLTERFSASAMSPAAPAGGPTLPALPRPPTRLLGRDRDIGQVLDILADPTNRIVTIGGTGGIGKSRVAVAVADRAKDRFPDGVAYVELAAVTEPPLLLPTIAKALGVEERGLSVRAQLRDRLADARILIVLDNMEQLATAAGDVADLLADADAFQVLVTSRRVLNIRGECVVTLEPLAVPAAGNAMTDAVELFLERARAVRPEFRPREDELATIAELTWRLDGLPLAIELAAARLRLLSSPRAILQRMGHHRLEFLRTGARDLPPRQRTLRDTIAWSHSLLPSAAQQLFARLSVFVGSATLEAIEQVTNPDDTLSMLDLLADLVDQSLVQATGEASEPRFGMLETIREFAIEQLQTSGEAADYRARHEAYYLALAERGNAGLGTAEQVDWLDRLGRENDNFRAVLRRAIRRDDAATAVRMGRALASYWHMGSSHSEGRSWMEQITALPSAGPHERAATRIIAAIHAFWQGDFELLDARLDDALHVTGADEDRRLVAFAQLLQAIVSGIVAGERRRDGLAEASRRLEAEGEPLAVGFGLVARAYLARVDGHADEARHLAQAAYDRSTRRGEWYVRMIASSELARTVMRHETSGASTQKPMHVAHARLLTICIERRRNHKISVGR
jgi:predicted ATPase